MDDKMLPLPIGYQERVAIDRRSNTVYVDKRYAGDPILLTWQSRNRSNDVNLIIKPAEVDEVAKLRADGMRVVESADSEMLVRENAIEIIRLAASYGASDIHFMLRGEYTEIQIVIKGGLRVLMRKSQQEGENLTRSIYQGIAKTRDSDYKPLDFQNAQIPGDALPPDAGLASVRIVRGPCYPQAQNGSFMTMRLQYSAVQSGVEKVSLPQLPIPRRPDGELRLTERGYTTTQVEKIQFLMAAPNGVVIFTGPTGSGKTTTMFEALKDIARTKPHRRLVTIEDPVEYPMDWAVQLAITGAKNDAETGAAFAERGRVALRMAPHIILMGELRGPEVAVTALEMAVTGHQVWTTMHVTDPFLFVERLEMMDRTRLDRRVFCDHKIVRGVIAQRLLPKLCPDCSTLLKDTPGVLAKRIVLALQTWGDISKIRVQGKGCESCGYDGTLGRFAVAEIVVMNAAVMRDFVEHGSETARDNHRAKPDADPSMLKSAIDHALAGLVDPRSVEEEVDIIEANIPDARKLFGEKLIEAGIITREQRDNAISAQLKLRDNGDTKRLGDVLVGMGYCTDADVLNIMNATIQSA
jgi:general secretion pathway protein E